MSTLQRAAVPVASVTTVGLSNPRWLSATCYRGRRSRRRLLPRAGWLSAAGNRPPPASRPGGAFAAWAGPATRARQAAPCRAVRCAVPPAPACPRTRHAAHQAAGPPVAALRPLPPVLRRHRCQSPVQRATGAGFGRGCPQCRYGPEMNAGCATRSPQTRAHPCATSTSRYRPTATTACRQREPQ